MKNVKVELKKNILTLTVDLAKNFGPSSSGKTTTIATTEGNKGVDGKEHIRYGLNVFAYPERPAKTKANQASAEATA